MGLLLASYCPKITSAPEGSSNTDCKVSGMVRSSSTAYTPPMDITLAGASSPSSQRNRSK